MQNRATALAPWAGWIAGIALSWTASGIVAAGAWWLLYWPAILGVAVAYSRLEEGRRTEAPGLASRHSAEPPIAA
jgi:hypothetical protein